TQTRHSLVPVLSIYFSLEKLATTKLYTLSLHDALPISERRLAAERADPLGGGTERLAHLLDGHVLLQRELLELLHDDGAGERDRSEEHTSELQSRFDLVCRLLLEKIKNKQ